MKNFQSPSQRRGFTLVELLVVIAIIITIAGIGSAVFMSIKKSAAATKCTKNMKDIYDSLLTLSAEGVNTGMHAPNTFPPYRGDLQGNRASNFVWWDLAAEKIGVARRDAGGFKWSAPFEETIFQNPLSKKILGRGKSDWSSLYNNPDLSLGGFAYNGKLGGDVSSNAPQETVFVERISASEDPSQTIYFAEADDKILTPGWVFESIDDAPQGNYKDGAHCCFIDGHVDHVLNSNLKNVLTFDFLTDLRDKNWSNQP